MLSIQVKIVEIKKMKKVNYCTNIDFFFCVLVGFAFGKVMSSTPSVSFACIARGNL